MQEYGFSLTSILPYKGRIIVSENPYSSIFNAVQIINFDGYVNEIKTEHNLKWPYLPDDPYSIKSELDF